jgi:hypothetical protein
VVALSRLTLPCEGVAFDPTTGDTFMVNDSGTWILKAFQIGHSKSEIIRMLRDEFQISQEDAERDVTDFHGRLQHLHLV